jgi:hypothetical protein
MTHNDSARPWVRRPTPCDSLLRDDQPHLANGIGADLLHDGGGLRPQLTAPGTGGRIPGPDRPIPSGADNDLAMVCPGNRGNGTRVRRHADAHT